MTATLRNPWPSAAVSPTLHAREVHVVSAEMSTFLPWIEGFERILAPEERSEARRFRFRRSSERFIIRRGLLRTLLSIYAGRRASELTFGRGPHGKPALLGSSDMRELSLSVSHSYDLVLYAFARGREIGIDVELVRQVPQGDEIAARFFTLREQAAYLSLEERDRPHAFLRWWTCKEAYLKATGAGLGGGLDAIDVALARDEPAKLVRVAGDGHEATRWSLTELAPADAYLGALVADGRELQPRCWHLPDARACLGIGP